MFEHIECERRVILPCFKLALPGFIKIDCKLADAKVFDICELIDTGHLNATFYKCATDCVAISASDIYQRGTWSERQLPHEVMQCGRCMLGAVNVCLLHPDIEFRIVKYFELHESEFERRFYT